MAAVSESDTALATQCMDFCQALARQGRVFQLSIAIGSTFTFSLDTREGKEILPIIKKRSSPSTLRRNAERRKEFLAKKATSKPSVAPDLESSQKQMKQGVAFPCDQCDANFKTENGLKIHKGKSHKEASLPEKLRTSSPQPSLNVSPLRDQDRLESCPNCEKEMSLTHLCQDLDLTLDEGYQDGDKTEAVEGNCNCDCPLPICCTCLHDVQCSCYKDNPDSTTCSCDAH